MIKSKFIQSQILFTLTNNKRWMTANEIISWGSINYLMDKKNNSQRKAKSHPVFRILTAMTRENDPHNVYTNTLTRRVRTSGPEMGMYEYTLNTPGSKIARLWEAIKNC